ncbi:histidine kinase [soil metagenome]
MLISDLLETAPRFIDNVVESILEKLQAAVLTQSSSAAHRVEYDHELEASVTSIVEETITCAITGDRFAAGDTDAHGTAKGVSKGGISESRGSHPAVVLATGQMIFEVSLPVITAALDRQSIGSVSTVRIAVELHRATWRRLSPTAVAHVNNSTQELAAAHEDGRRFLSRELHDRVAPDIAAALIRVESLATTNLEAKVVAKLVGTAEFLLRNTLRDVQDLAVAVRHIRGSRDFTTEIGALADSPEEAAIPVVIQSRGRPRALSEAAKEEGLTIVRESIRNARQHAASARSITVRLRWSEHAVELTVADDGRGFDLSAVQRDSLGLRGMRERAEGVGATLSVDSGSDGTVVRLLLPVDSVVARS